MTLKQALKRGLAPFLAPLALLAALALADCTLPARTIYPTPPAGMPLTYTWTTRGEPEVRPPDVEGNFVLPAGEYTLEVNAYLDPGHTQLVGTGAGKNGNPVYPTLWWSRGIFAVQNHPGPTRGPGGAARLSGGTDRKPGGTTRGPTAMVPGTEYP